MKRNQETGEVKDTVMKEKCQHDKNAQVGKKINKNQKIRKTHASSFSVLSFAISVAGYR